jgi:hypothetical protein
LLFCCFHFRLTFESIKELGNVSNMVYVTKGYEMVTWNGINMTMVNFDLVVGI